jgi:hypothetical protein
MIHKNIRISNAIVSDILDSDHLPIVFHILDAVRATKVSESLEKFTDWEWFQNLTSNLMSPRHEINFGVEVDKVACVFAASVSSADRLSTSRITLSR